MRGRAVEILRAAVVEAILGRRARGGHGAPRRTRTPDPSLRRRLLFPPELSGRSGNLAGGAARLRLLLEARKSADSARSLTPPGPRPRLARPTVGVAQLVRAPGCGPGGRGFDPPRSPHRIRRRLGRLQPRRCRLCSRVRREGPYRAVWSRRSRGRRGPLLPRDHVRVDALTATEECADCCPPDLAGDEHNSRNSGWNQRCRAHPHIGPGARLVHCHPELKLSQPSRVRSTSLLVQWDASPTASRWSSKSGGTKTPGLRAGWPSPWRRAFRPHA